MTRGNAIHPISPKSFPSIYFHSAVDLAHKDVAGIEAHRARQAEEANGYHAHVTCSSSSSNKQESASAS